MRIGIIGVGKMGLLHAAILNSMEEVELVGIAETSSFIRKCLKTIYPSINEYKNYIDMQDKEDLDAVFITTPIFLHVPMAIDCLKRDINFFIEKPLSLSSDDARDLIKMLENKKIVNMVGYCMRYMETFHKTKEIIESKALGNIFSFTSTMYISQLFRKGKGWRYTKEESGGGVLNGLATHLIDLLLWYFGDVQSVNGHIESWYSDEIDDFAHGYLHFKNGLSGWFDTSWSVRHHRLPETRIEVHAENGTLLVTDDYVNLYLEKNSGNYSSGWTKYRKPDLWQGVEIEIGGAEYTKEDRAFIDAIHTKSIVESNAKQAYSTQCVVDAIYSSSSQKGKNVILNTEGYL